MYMYNLIIIRPSEFSIKSQQVKKKFLNHLKSNILFQLSFNNIKIEKIWNDYDLIFIKIFENNKNAQFKSKSNNFINRLKLKLREKKINKIISVLNHVFGIYSISLAISTSSEIEKIYETLYDYLKYILQPNQSFGVRIKRVGSQNYSSMELASKLGSFILNKFRNFNLKVNLSNPDIWLYVSVRHSNAYIYSNILNTPWSGMPIYLQSGVIATLTGDISEIISSFLIMKRGCTLLPICLIENKKVFKKIYIPILKAFKKYIPLYRFNCIIFNLKQLFSYLNQISEHSNLNLKYIYKSAPLNIRRIIKSIIIRKLGILLINNYFKILNLKYPDKKFFYDKIKTIKILSKIKNIKFSNITIFPNNFLMVKNKNQFKIRFKSISEGNNLFAFKILFNNSSININEYYLNNLILFGAISFQNEELEKLCLKINPKLNKIIKKLEKDINENRIDMKYFEYLKMISDGLDKLIKQFEITPLNVVKLLKILTIK